MKKAIIILLSVICLSSCFIPEDYAQIKFQNDTADCTFNYGVRFGDIYYSDSIPLDTSTEYEYTAPGSYKFGLVQVHGGTTYFGDEFSVAAGNKYTITVTGALSDLDLNVAIIQD